MGDQATNALAALILGSVVAVLLFIPVAAVQYRRDGGSVPGDLAVLVGCRGLRRRAVDLHAAAAPDMGEYACQHAQTQLMAFADDIRRAAAGRVRRTRDPERLLRNRAFLQVALNVLLFVPFGVFVRLVTHRGIVVATALGFAVSLLIEVTQLTGVWGVYPCAYRLFDVDDLLTNTLGAFIGALALLPVRRAETPPARYGAAGVADDGVGGTPPGGNGERRALRGAGRHGGGRALAGLLVYAQDERPATDSPSMIALRAGVPLLVQVAIVLLAGKTIGELVVDLRTTPASTSRRLVKLAVGVVPLVLLAVVTAPAAQVALLVLAVAGLVGVFVTRGHRGFSNAAAGLGLEIDDS